MDNPPTVSPLDHLSSAFVAACRDSRSERELFERCHAALVRRFRSEHIWLTISPVTGPVITIGDAEGRAAAEESARIGSGETQVTIHASPAVAVAVRAAAMPLALALSVVIELRSVLLERQTALDDATFQLRALRQVARLLSSVHSIGETEQLIMDFMAEVFFAWWACLYRPDKGTYVPHVYRAVGEEGRPEPIEQEALDCAFPIGNAPMVTEEVALAELVDPRTRVMVSLDAGPERLAVLALGTRISGKGYGTPEFELAGTLAFAAAIALKNAHLVEQLHSAATTDDLTGLYNRRAVEQRLEAEISRATRHQLNTTVVLLDVDRFKQVNDTMGHAAGDRLLVRIGRILRRQARTLDVVGRLGGDEFLVILPMTLPREAMVFVSRVLNDIAEMESAHPEFGRRTVSLGLAAAPQHGTSAGEVLAAADEALYKAKRGGRNMAEIAEDR